MEAQLPTHYNEGTIRSCHYNLDPMKVIMQKLQLMRKDMKEMRGNDMSLLILNGDMVTSLLMLELLSIILMITLRAVDLELDMVIVIHLVKEFQGMNLKMEGIM
ncbi:hypothetical protein M9H77_30723 [Catharanthus roseus]|uniref:Uncharacterized protein n=1 Tax=Catharanthus roseus TaxID=4058 RepID=A0ACC0A1Z0_CATRO|nr:hypothetical protein M9H77_30723 [Catharanthus roseus]